MDGWDGIGNYRGIQVVIYDSTKHHKSTFESNCHRNSLLCPELNKNRFKIYRQEKIYITKEPK